MSFRILQNNQLYRKLQHKNAFKTFSRGCNRSLMSKKQQAGNASNRILQRTVSSTAQTIDLLKNFNQQWRKRDNNDFESFRNPVQLRKPERISQKYSTKMPMHDIWISSKTEPTYPQDNQQPKERKFSQNTTLLTHNTRNSETQLLQSNFRRINQNFKLKSCLAKGKICYDGPSDETDFSTLQNRKRSQILSQIKDRAHQKYQENSRFQQRNRAREILKKMHPSIERYPDGFLVSKYSKFSRQGLKCNIQKAKKQL